ncbi:MAG: ATP-binding cassette domain-containing protein [Zetaproteobacteria bacterium]|nr:MAG: ATP-binding cassette domain-containing protein [Zetaproteobacteria bacterium]
MPLLVLKEVTKAFGDRPVLDRASLTVGRGERIGLIGRNGEGKSTLLKVMAGLIEPDEGEVTLRAGARVAWLPQQPEVDGQATVFATVAGGLGDAAALLGEHEAVQRAAEAGDPAALARLPRLQEAMERAGSWQVKAQVDAVISRLGLDGDALMERLSGGWQRRVALARAVVGAPDLLLLDEPTNHLDVATIEWLEEFIADFAGAIVVVTHDRYFLDAVGEAIVELDRGRLKRFDCGYADYLERKAAQLELEARQMRKFDRLLAAEERWIRRGIPARRKRDEGRVRRLEELRRQRAERRLRGDDVTLRVACGIKPGKLLLDAEGLSHTLGGTVICRDFDFRLMAGERVGLIGPNGVGKSTLLKLLLGEMQPDGGRVRHGVRLAPAFLTQQRTLDPTMKLRDVLLPDGGNYVHIAGVEPRHVVSYLEEFLFDRSRLNARVGALSGGERGRLLLARLLLQPANLLVLDEPTNDLDIGTLTVLEQALARYNGTVLLVSHDRAFMDRVVGRVLAFEGEGRIVPIVGGYSDYAAWKLRRRAEEQAAAAPARRNAPPRPRSERRPNRLGYKEQRRLAALPGEIEALEAECAELESAFTDPDFYQRDPEGFVAAQRRLEQCQRELEAAYAEWAALEERAEQVAGG